MEVCDLAKKKELIALNLRLRDVGNRVSSLVQIESIVESAESEVLSQCSDVIHEQLRHLDNYILDSDAKNKYNPVKLIQYVEDLVRHLNSIETRLKYK
jgi:hypothetical protein